MTLIVYPLLRLECLMWLIFFNLLLFISCLLFSALFFHDMVFTGDSPAFANVSPFAQ